MVSVFSLTSHSRPAPLSPAEIKGFLHCAHVHIGMPWHMFESEHNMCEFTFECVCARQ